MKKLALHWQIIIGMVLGVLFGLLFLNFEWGKTFIINWIKPFGTIFINSLKLIAVPLILASLIKGISDLKDLSKLSSMGGITIATYIFTTMMAVSIGLVAVNIIEPGNFISEETREQLVNAYSLNANEKIEAAINNIITNLTTKSALKKSFHNEKSVAPPNPTTWAAISCSIKVDYF